MSQPLRVIIVEDEALLAMELESLVEDAGHEVAGWATSLKEARDLIDAVAADVAFVDVHLADGPTGVDVAAYIRDSGKTMAVFMTANPKRIPPDFVGAVGVISKPYTVHGLSAALRYLEEGIRRPPPHRARPVGFTLSPSYDIAWAPKG